MGSRLLGALLLRKLEPAPLGTDMDEVLRVATVAFILCAVYFILAIAIEHALP
jgi:hypothetical protein